MKDFEKETSVVDPLEKYEYLRQAAMKGSRAAQVNLGIWYLTGEYYPPDEQSAFGWFEMAAQNAKGSG